MHKQGKSAAEKQGKDMQQKHKVFNSQDIQALVKDKYRSKSELIAATNRLTKS